MSNERKFETPYTWGDHNAGLIKHKVEGGEWKI